MKISLSALVPVCNSQTTIGSLVLQLLEVLSELTDRFELVVIDNGSTDSTAEMIADLAILYPQMSRVVLPSRVDRATVMRTGLMHSSGDAVLFRSEKCGTGLAALGELWQSLRLGDIAVVRPREAATLGSIPPLPTEESSDEPDWLMVRRRVLDGWLRTRSTRDWASFLAARGYAVQEIDPRAFGSRVLSRSTVGLKLPAAMAHPRPQVAASHGSRPTRRPNYLDRIKAFALGE